MTYINFYLCVFFVFFSLSCLAVFDNCNGYLIIKGTGIGSSSNMYLKPAHIHSFKKQDDSVFTEILPIYPLKSLPSRVMSKKLKYPYMGVDRIGDIPDVYSSCSEHGDVVFGKFRINKKKALKEGRLVFKELVVENSKGEEVPDIMSFWEDDDAYVHARGLTGLTHEPAGSDLKVCVLYPKKIIRKSICSNHTEPPNLLTSCFSTNDGEEEGEPYKSVNEKKGNAVNFLTIKKIKEMIKLKVTHR